MSRLPTFALAICVFLPVVPCRAASPDDDVKILERHGLTTDGLGFTYSVFLKNLELTDDAWTEVVEAMVRIKTMRHISIENTPLAPVFTRELPKLQKLLSLALTEIDLDASTIRAASRIRDLDCVTISQCRLTGDVVGELGKCEQLRTIFFVKCDDLKGDVFGPLVPLKRLTWLVVNYCPGVTDEGLRH
jgi:hypothetical protein